MLKGSRRPNIEKITLVDFEIDQSLLKIAQPQFEFPAIRRPSNNKKDGSNGFSDNMGRMAPNILAQF
jgi:hypothetical protein